MMRSLKARLLVGITSGMIGLLTLFGVTIYAAVYRSLTSAFDISIATAARAVASRVEQKRNRLEFEYADLKMPEFERERHPDYFQLWRQDGRALARSPSLGARDLPQMRGTSDAPGSGPIILPNGQPGRMMGFEFTAKVEHDDDSQGQGDHRDERVSDQPQRVLIVLARESDELDEQLGSLRWVLVSASAGMIVLALGVAMVVVRRALRPVDRLAAEIASIDANELGTRVEDLGLPTEMVPVARRLNELLKRLEEAFHRERSFTADVAHELRTPLAGLYSIVEFALSRERPASEYREAFADCLNVSKHMRSMLDNLLMLARLDAGQIQPRLEKVAMAGLIEDCWRLHAEKAAARGIAFDNALPADLECSADLGIVSLVVSNVLANAAEYANEGGCVRVEVAGEQPLEMLFTNTGCRLAPDQVAHVFERFWRGDPARTGTGVHCGLGLALVQRAVQAIGGKASASIQHGGVFAIRLSFPQ